MNPAAPTQLASHQTIRPRPTLGLGAAAIGQEEEDLLLEVIRSRQLFRYAYDLPPEEQGKMTGTLEREFREMIGVDYALAVTSGSAALEVAFGALGVGRGDEVIVAAWSFTACFTSIVRVGALPVLAEIDDSFCLAPGEIKRMCTPRTKAVLVVHYQGVAADMDAIMAEAKEAGIAVVEDCAESTGAFYRGRRVGSFGDVGIFSFQFAKTMTSGEGGIVVMNDPKLYERTVRFHDLGSIRAPHHAQVTPGEPAFCGGQFRMNELTAAVALAQRRKVDSIRNHCRALNKRIMDEIGGLKGLEFRSIPDPEGESGFEIYFCLESPELAKRFTAALDARNVNCAKMTNTYCQYSKPQCMNALTHAPANSPFSKFEEWPAPGYRKDDFPRTEGLVHRFVVLPLGILYTMDDADYIARTVKELHSELI